MTVVFGIRCREAGEKEVSLFNKLAGIVGSESVCLLMDRRGHDWLQRKKKVESILPHHYIAFNAEDIEMQSGEYGSFRQNWGWQNGDYFYYAALRERDFDHLYLWEGDVHCTDDTLRDLITATDGRSIRLSCL